MMLFLLKSAFVLTVVYGFYKIFLEKERFFKLNRMYLLLGLILTFVLPFVTLPELVDHQGIVHRVISTSDDTIASPRPIRPDKSDAKTESRSSVASSGVEVSIPTKPKRRILYWIALLYFFGVAVLSLNFLTQLGGLLLRIIKSRDRVYDFGVVILNQRKPTEPCSFFQYIFIQPNAYDENTYNQILEHEKVHVRQRHSFDLLLSELAIIVLWFNPFVWQYRKEVERNMEYQTDALLIASRKVDSEAYQLNLLTIARRKRTNALVSNYNESLIKKRIIMMNKQQSNPSGYWKYAFLVPTLFVTLLLLNQPTVLKAQEPLDEVYRDTDDGNHYENDFDNDLQPFLRAVQQGDYKVVERMLADGADVDLMQAGEGTPLTLAIDAEHFDIAELLLEKGADPNLGSEADGHPIWMAASKGNLKLVRQLVAQGADVNTQFPGDGSALIQAASTGNLDMVKLLVELKADVNMMVEGDGNPLIAASKQGNLTVVTYLVNEGADVNAEVRGDETPLINASEQGHLPIVKLLIEQGAEVNKVCKEKMRDGKIRVRTALQMAKKRGHDAVIEYLVGKGAID